MPIFKNQIELRTLDDWERLAGPKSADQWVDGRSAKEVARAWLGGNGHLPPEVDAVLLTHAAFGAVSNWEGEAEVRLRFDEFAGEPRNSDLVVYAQDNNGPFVLAVEAKADEPFSETVAETLFAALERYLRNDRSNGIARVQRLSRALLGPRQVGDPPVQDLRYQLLTACAGAMCEAERRGCTRALMLVHEFVSDKTRDDNQHRNAADLNAFLRRLSHGKVMNIGAGEIRGPFTVPGAPIIAPGTRLFIGKVSRNIRTKST